MTSFVKGGEPLLTQPMYASRTPKIIHQGNFIVTKDSPQNYVLNAKNILAATLVIYFTNLLLSTWVPLIKILTTSTSPNHPIRFKHILNSVPVQDRLQPMLRFQEELQIFWGRGLFVVGSCRNEDKILSRYWYKERAPKNIRFCGVYIPQPSIRLSGGKCKSVKSISNM